MYLAVQKLFNSLRRCPAERERERQYYTIMITAHHKLNYWQILVNFEVGLLENTGGSVRATFSQNTTPFSRLLCGMSLHMGLGRAREKSLS